MVRVCQQNFGRLFESSNTMKWLILIAALLASPAQAGQIDYFCIFTNAAAAQADANVGPFWNGTTWDTSTVFPGISVTTPHAS